MKILVVGGGSAGLISALILKKFLNCTVDIVHSSDIGTIGVGEGSTEHFNDFMNFIGIDQFSIIKECDATFKSGIMFDNWSDKSYLHNVSSPFNNKIAQYSNVYARQISNNENFMNSSFLWENKISKWFINKNEFPPFNQYHFNTNKLNIFLQKTCNDFNINIFDDKIEKINFKENGEIDSILGDKQIYNYDFYIDCTGFKKMLIKEMGAKWISFDNYLKMKSAIVFSTPDENEYNLWTLAKAMDYGWRFKIPTWGRSGNGYIFDSDYISADEAKEEIDKEFGYDVEISKEFNFNPGYLDRVWIKNCVAIGLSGSFVEPLEATSIGTTIQQTYLLMHKILNYSQKEIDSYNKNFESIMENIRDFIFLHYITKKDNNFFWKDIKNIEYPDTLKNNLEIWKNKIPIKEDFIEQSQYSLFWEDNFIIVMAGLKLFNNNNIKKEYDMIAENIKYAADQIIFEQKLLNNKDFISHKEYLRIIKEYL